MIVFALLATIIPAVTMGWLSYVQNRKFLNEKIKQELRVVTSQVSRELDLWLKDRLYDLRVFSSSYVVLENLEKMLRQGSGHIENVVAYRRLKDFLVVDDFFPDRSQVIFESPVGYYVFYVTASLAQHLFKIF